MLCKWVSTLISIPILTAACALPLGTAGNAPPVNQPTSTPSPYGIPDSAVPVAAPTSTPPQPALSPADLPFFIDCSAIDPSRQAECDAYLANTRDRSYPLLRQLTGTSLSTCYDAVHYTIVEDAQLQDWQGQADENWILYSLRSSLDAAPAPLHDAHELLHTLSACSGALDLHVFHGAFESYVDLTLTGTEWQSPGRENIVNWLETKLIPDLGTTTAATPSPGAGQTSEFETCVQVYGSLTTILYYDYGIETIKQLYQDTIAPPPGIVPNEKLLTLFGPRLGSQFQVLVDALKQNQHYQVIVPECGY